MMDYAIHSGVLIKDILGSSLAELNGFQLNDLVQEVNGNTVGTRAEIFDQLTQSHGRNIVEIKVLRGNASFTLQIQL